MPRNKRSRKSKSSASGPAESSNAMATSSTTPFERIDITCRTPNVSAYDVFKKFEHIGEICDVEKNDDVTFTVWFVDEAEQKEVEEPVSEKSSRKKRKMNHAPPDQQSPSHIMNALSNDCLIEIFERLDLPNLYQLAWVSKRFRSIAVRVFKIKYKNERLNVDHLERLGRSNTALPLSHFINFLRIFSPTRVDLPECYDQNVILQAMAEYCTDFDWLDLCSVDDSLDPQASTALRLLLSKVRELVFPTPNILDAVLANIKTPKLTNLFFIDPMAYGAPDSTRFGSAVFDFLAKNGGRVTKLGFQCCTFSWARWCSLAECAPNVEQLTIEYCGIRNANDQQPGTFKRLTACVLLESDHWDFLVKLLVGAPLDHLQMSSYRKADVVPIDIICRLTTITKLSMDLNQANISDTELLQLARSLSGLQELQIKECRFRLASIRRILNESETIVKLSIGLHRDAELSFEPAILNDISAIIAARPELRQIKISAFKKRLESPLRNWRPYSHWLEVIKREDYSWYGIFTEDTDDIDSDTDDDD